MTCEELLQLDHGWVLWKEEKEEAEVEDHYWEYVERTERDDD